MKKVLQGETVSRETDVKGNMAIVKHVTKAKGLGDTLYHVTTVFDFTDVTRDELIKQASRALIIDMRPKAKKATTEAELMALLEPDEAISVREFLDRERKVRMTTAERVKAGIGRMTPEERAELMRELLAEQE